MAGQSLQPLPWFLVGLKKNEINGLDVTGFAYESTSSLWVLCSSLAAEAEMLPLARKTLVDDAAAFLTA